MTQAELVTYFNYNPETGQLFWKVQLSNRTKVGAEVLGCDRNGYRRVGIHGKVYLAHRIIWCLVTGAWPTNDIDHIDGNPANNSWGNLRDVSRSVNLSNQKKRRPKTGSPLKGAYWDKNAKRWMSEIKIEGVRKYLGYFNTPEEAHTAYMSMLQSATK